MPRRLRCWHLNAAGETCWDVAEQGLVSELALSPGCALDSVSALESPSSAAGTAQMTCSGPVLLGCPRAPKASSSLSLKGFVGGQVNVSPVTPEQSP